jgi:hypothetical protein
LPLKKEVKMLTVTLEDVKRIIGLQLGLSAVPDDARITNGKIQHGLLRGRYLDGILRGSGAILYPEY